jgi:hypothetical protein
MFFKFKKPLDFGTDIIITDDYKAVRRVILFIHIMRPYYEEEGKDFHQILLASHCCIQEILIKR